MNNISKGTIVRTILLVIVIINWFLKAIGKPLIDIDENAVMYWLEFAIEIVVVIVNFWKNNSFSKNAIKADKFLQALKNEEKETNLNLNTDFVLPENTFDTEDEEGV